jgi:hypothetical protein
MIVDKQQREKVSLQKELTTSFLLIMLLTTVICLTATHLSHPLILKRVGDLNKVTHETEHYKINDIINFIEITSKASEKYLWLEIQFPDDTISKKIRTLPRHICTIHIDAHTMDSIYEKKKTIKEHGKWVEKNYLFINLEKQI